MFGIKVNILAKDNTVIASLAIPGIGSALNVDTLRRVIMLAKNATHTERRLGSLGCIPKCFSTLVSEAVQK